MRDVVKEMKALSDETRLRILGLLLERECCVCEVMQALGISQTRASRNLGILRDAGFLAMRKEGLWVLYSLDQDQLIGHRAAMIQAVRESLEHDEVAALDRKRLKTAVRVGPGCGGGTRSVAGPLFSASSCGHAHVSAAMPPILHPFLEKLKENFHEDTGL